VDLSKSLHLKVVVLTAFLEHIPILLKEDVCVLSNNSAVVVRFSVLKADVPVVH